jgi:exodeoxyribonuclease V alpha subunit
MILDDLARAEVLGPLDVCFARAIARLAGESRPEVLLGAALASRAVQRGHVCVDLATVAERGLVDDDGTRVPVDLPSLDAWLALLRTSPLVQHLSPPEGGRAGEGVSGLAPLVLEPAGRLYLYRYFDYQRRLARQIRDRAALAPAIDEALLRDGLDRLFPGVRRGDDDRQRLAAIAAVERGFTVIAGGPGTGKTTTVAKVIALLQEQALAGGAPLRVLLVAPTGKAAQRLRESITATAARLDVGDRVRRAIFDEAGTIHRALGFQPRSPTRFRHGAADPLPAEVVVADEASMIDLALLTKLFEAAAPAARVILLGDQDQLASVEAGAVLGDIHHDRAHAVTPDFARRVHALTGVRLPSDAAAPPLADCLVTLVKSHRYGEHSAIGALARAVVRGDADEALRALRHEQRMPYGEVVLHDLDEEHPLRGHFGAAVVDGFAAYLRAATPADRLEALGRFRILCAHRRGPLGAVAVNALVEQHFAAAGLLQLDGNYYDGRPILVTRNDYALDLFNGDAGVIATDAHGDRKAYFPGARGPRAIPVGRLPPHETVFAMTVHKSQGSELDRVALLLPARMSPILTRELVYTGVSRARVRVDLFGAAEVLRGALERRIDRPSGLRAALWGSA